MSIDWAKLVEGAQRGQVAVVAAQTFRQHWASFSRPVAVGCDDKNIYVIKGLRVDADMTSALITEHVAARLGRALGAPIPGLAFVQLAQELIDAEPQLQHLKAGLTHGLRLVDNCSDKQGIEPPTTDRNREAYAPLAVLYGWFQAGDHQLVKTLDAQGDVYSVDHGLFLPGAQNWTIESLAAAGPAVLDPQFDAHITPADRVRALDRLALLSDQAIGNAVAGPPDEWGITSERRIALAAYLSSRRDTLILLRGV